MSFFDKFFSHKNRNNKNDHGLKASPEPINFKPSHLSISKDQIRFVLFRECERRGRKLLFDSNTVEKLPLASKGTSCSPKCQQSNNERVIDFIETTGTHGYKYKKPSGDVPLLGEMIFGSVAMVYKGENSCKIHCIPSPRRIMFTTIVHAPSRCQFSTSEQSLESSCASFNEMTNQKQTSSSDSKLYRREGVSQKQSSTYPWIRHNSPLSKISQCCEIGDSELNLIKRTFMHGNIKLGCLENLCLSNENSEVTKCSLTQEGKSSSEKLDESLLIFGVNNLSMQQKSSDCERDSAFDSSIVTSTSSNESENVSSVSGSLSSLRRRWAQSCSTSLDSTTYEDTSSSPSKKKTKLGMALVLDLSHSPENQMEDFLFNHTIVIDSIMRKLQSSVETAYVKNENFVDLIYNAFLDSQHSIYELITGRKCTTPVWLTLMGDGGSDDADCADSETGFPAGEKAAAKNEDRLNNLRLKFLNDFCDLLVKFDTKDTNFFMSTLLTAVLTHHLSWVTTIAETDISNRHKKLHSVIKNLRPYNPLWAQLNDLCGLLGSPLKCAKTVITGGESKRSHMSNIIEVLTYFIRCYNVVENVYDVDFEELSVADLTMEGCGEKAENVDSGIDSDVHTSATLEVEVLESKCLNPPAFEMEKKQKNGVEVIRDEIVANDGVFSQNHQGGVLGVGVGGGLKRSKSCLSQMKLEESATLGKLYPDIKDMAKSENIRVADLNHGGGNDTTVYVETFLSNEKLAEKIQRMIRVPCEVAKSHSEGYLSPDEGYDTIESLKAGHSRSKKVQMEKQRSSQDERKENIVFVLGENEELVNLQKKVVLTKSSVIDMEKEDSNVLVLDCDNVSTNTRVTCSENKSEGNVRTFEKLNPDKERDDRTLWVKSFDDKLSEHSKGEDHVGGKRLNSWKVPWMIRELHLPSIAKPSRTKRLEICSVLGGINQHYNSEQVLQGVLDPRANWEHTLQKDLYLCAHNGILEKNVNEALCIVGDLDSWEVSVFSSNTSLLDRNKNTGVRVGMSQLVADMLESLLYIHKINLSPNFCLLHIEKKLHEIYLKSQTVAELLNSTDLCSIEYLTTRLDIGINDVPLLLSVATTHSPQISEKYGLSFT